MIVPCMVNSWLNCSVDRNCSSGRASSARISIAIAPPAMKNPNDVTRYRIAMSLGSVVWSILRKVDPLPVRRAGYGRDVIGVGAGVVRVIATSGNPASGLDRHAEYRADVARPHWSTSGGLWTTILDNPDHDTDHRSATTQSVAGSSRRNQRIADPGACGKTPVLPQNRRSLPVNCGDGGT